MSEVRYRPAMVEDAAELAALRIRTFTDTFGHLYRPEDLAEFLAEDSEDYWREQLSSPDYAIRVAEAGGALIAYVKLGPPTLPVEPAGVPIEVRQFYMLAPWHGSGLADTLMRWALAEAKARGADDAYLSVYSENHRARRFYERYGFAFAGRHPFKVGNQLDDDHMMHLSLREPA